MYKKVMILGAIVGLGWGGARLYHHIQFDRQVTGNLKLAADATNVELAEDRLSIAIDGMETRSICRNFNTEQCYTSLLWTTPDEDVTFWRQNTAQALVDLQELPPDADALTVSNTLMKVRETLLDEGESVSVTTPPGMELWPNNWAYAIWGWAAALLMGVPIAILAWKERIWR